MKDPPGRVSDHRQVTRDADAAKSTADSVKSSMDHHHRVGSPRTVPACCSAATSAGGVPNPARTVPPAPTRNVPEGAIFACPVSARRDEHAESTRTFLGQLGRAQKAERARLQAEYDRAARVLARIDEAAAAGEPA